MKGEILIVGAGVMGCALARELCRRGAEVTVLEKSIPGAQASSAAAGILGPRAERCAGPMLELGLLSLGLWPSFAADLGDVGLQLDGVWLADPEAPTTPEELRIGPARLFEGEGAVDAQILPIRLADSARDAGARFVNAGEVTEVVSARGRVEGVRTTRGDFAANTVVICAGAWSGKVPGLRPVPVEPVRGQLLVLKAAPGLLPRVAFTGRGYLVPRADGRVLVGATTERVGFEERVTAAGLHHLLDLALAALPALGAATVIDHWSGFRPGTPDELPLMGPTDLRGLYVSSGHYRNGILLTPIAARLLAQVLAGEPTDMDLAPFDPRRFS